MTPQAPDPTQARMKCLTRIRRWQTSLLLMSGGLLVTGFILIPLDIKLISYISLPDHDTRRLLHPVMVLGKTRIVIYALMIVASLGACQWWLGSQAWRTRGKAAFKVALLALGHFLLSGSLVQIIKWATGRPRPEFAFIDNSFTWLPFQSLKSHVSFPSGHANTGLALALVFCYVFPHSGLRFVVFSLALVMGIGRIILYKHFPSDVFVGWSIACLTMSGYVVVTDRWGRNINS